MMTQELSKYHHMLITSGAYNTRDAVYMLTNSCKLIYSGAKFTARSIMTQVEKGST